MYPPSRGIWWSRSVLHQLDILQNAIEKAVDMRYELLNFCFVVVVVVTVECCCSCCMLLFICDCESTTTAEQEQQQHYTVTTILIQTKRLHNLCR